MADVLATVFEVTIVCGLLALLLGRGTLGIRLAPRGGAAVTWLLALLLAPLTSVALLAATGAAL